MSPEHEARIEARRALLDASARESGFWVSGDGRIGESDAAALLGFSPGSLANLRAEGSGPPWFRLGGQGHRVTYDLADIARWVEARRGDDWTT